MSRDDGIKLIAIYHFVMAGLCLLGGLFALLALVLPLVLSPMPVEAAGIILIVMGVVFVVLLGVALLYLVVGVGLWRRREWSRWAALVLAVLGLLNFPVGTVIGVLVLIFLVRDDVVAAFQGEE
jgi:lysylphosphatidylglycerol synthetase-like protein (DUF2156 family)